MTASSASPSSLGPIPECTIVQYILSNPHHVPLDKVIKIEAEGDRQLTYKDFCDSIMDVASGIRSELPQLAEGDFAFILSPNTFMLPSLILGIMGRGFVPVAIVASSSPAEIRHALTLVAPEGPKVIFVHPSLLAIAEKVIEELSLSHPPQLVLVTAPSDGIKLLNLEDLIKAGQEHPQPIAELRKPAKESLAAIYFSSGTTGPPKAVQTTHFQLVATTMKPRFIVSLIAEASETMLSVITLAGIYGQFTAVFEATLNGATNILLDRWDLRAWLNAVQEFQVTTAPITPPMALALARDPLIDEFNLSSLHILLVAGASTPAEVIKGLKARLGVEVINILGMTETMTSINCFPGEYCPEDSVGKANSDVEIKILNEKGEEVEDGEPGELVVKSLVGMTLGYLGNEKATKETMRDGWIYTGDFVKRNKDGFFSVLERKSDIINVKGHVVAPAELEAVLLVTPNVLDAAVVGTTESDGEVPRAFVIVEREKRTQSTAQQILSFVDEKVDQFQRIVGGLSFVDKIPKSPAGKILRRLLPRDSAIVAKAST